MNNQFLQHLKSLTPQGKAEEKKIFIPASEFKDKKADRIKVQADEQEQLDEATRSKYLKAYAKHKVGTDTGKLELARMKRSAAMLRRGGADDETMRAGVADKGDMKTYNRVAMAKYRFANKAARSEEDGKKSPRNVKEAVSTGDPNRGRMGRAKPKLPPGLDPYDMYSKGEIRPYGGKLQKRIASMSGEDRKRYYREIGIRSRAASRAGKTQRLFPMTEQEKPTTTPTSTSKPKKTFKPKFGSYDKMMPSAFRHGVAAHQKKKALGAKPITEAKKPLKKLKKVIKRVKRAVKGAYNILSTPQDNADYMMTGRKF